MADGYVHHVHHANAKFRKGSEYFARVMWKRRSGAPVKESCSQLTALAEVQLPTTLSQVRGNCGLAARPFYVAARGFVTLVGGFGGLMPGRGQGRVGSSVLHLHQLQPAIQHADI